MNRLLVGGPAAGVVGQRAGARTSAPGGELSLELGGGSILARAAGGDADAREQLFARHFDGVYAYLRMAATDPDRAEAQAVDVLCRAVGRHAEAPSQPADIDAWLRGIALERVASSAPAAPPAAAPAAGEAEPADAERLARLLGGVADRDLATLVRTLEPRARQAVVLGLMSGIDDVVAAAAIGVDPSDVPALKAAGLAEIGRLLTRYDRESEEIGILARKHAYHLRPQRGPVSDGMLVVRGTGMMVAPGPGNGLLHMAFRALARLLERLHLRHAGGSPLDGDVGEVKTPKALSSTPGQQAFAQPKPTPSMREYRTPEATPGMAGFRQPKATPSTERLSNPGRGGQVRGMAFGGTRKWC